MSSAIWRSPFSRYHHLLHAAAALTLIASGLLLRAAGHGSPGWLAEFAPDALWAMLVFCLLTWLRPRWPVSRLAGTALAFSYFIECSQLYHAVWLDAFRATTPGGLLLGRGFLWSDIACYTFGLAVAACLHTLAYQALPRLILRR